LKRVNKYFFIILYMNPYGLYVCMLGLYVCTLVIDEIIKKSFYKNNLI